MTAKAVGEKLLALERAALDQERGELAAGYRHAMEIVSEQSAEFVPLDAAKQFCVRHCWHGRKDEPGKSDECSICPLAAHTLGVVETDDDDRGDDVDAKRIERARRESSEAMRRMDAAGLPTLAAESNVVRSGHGTLQPGDE